MPRSSSKSGRARNLAADRRSVLSIYLDDLFRHGVGSKDAMSSSRRARANCSSFAPIGDRFCPMWCCSASRKCWCSLLRISRWRRADLALPSTRAANEFRRSSSSLASFARGTSSVESFSLAPFALPKASFYIPSLLSLLSLLPYYYFLKNIYF